MCGFHAKNGRECGPRRGAKNTFFPLVLQDETSHIISPRYDHRSPSMHPWSSQVEGYVQDLKGMLHSMIYVILMLRHLQSGIVGTEM